jgi:hypothetical protein
VAGMGVARCGRQASESPNASRYCTEKAGLSDRSSSLPFRTAVGMCKEIPVESFHCCMLHSACTNSGTSQECTRCQTKYSSIRRRSQELFSVWTGGQSETTCCLYSTANRRRANTCQSISVDGLLFTVQVLLNESNHAPLARSNP